MASKRKLRQKIRKLKALVRELRATSTFPEFSQPFKIGDTVTVKQPHYYSYTPTGG